MLKALKAKREVYYEMKRKSFYVKLGGIDRSDSEKFDDELEELKNRLCEKLGRLEKVKVDKIEEVTLLFSNIPVVRLHESTLVPKHRHGYSKD
jgi:hypothetical protein